MDPTVDTAPPPRTTGDDRRITPGRVAATVVVIVLVAMWAYAFSGLARKDPPDLLDDERFPTEAESICAATRDDLAELPAAQDARSPEERAVTVAQANVLLDSMVDDLAAIAPTEGGRDERITALWIDDWRIHLGDRERYVADLEAGSTEPAQFTGRGGRSITATIDNFAEVNAMESCATPLDL